MPELYLGSNGLSLWSSSDLGDTFNRMSTGAGMYSGSQVWALSAHPAAPDKVYIGTDTGVYVLNRSTQICRHLWSPQDCMLVTSLAHSPSDPDTLIAGTQPAGLYRSQDAGLHWEKLAADMKPYVTTGFPGSDLHAATTDTSSLVVRHWTRVTTIAIDPLDERRIWVGVEIDGVWMSTDGGSSWRKSSAGMITEDIHDFCLCRHGADTVLFAATNKGLHVSDDLGATWRMQPIASPWQYTRSIVERADGSGVMFMTNGDGPPGTCGRLFRSRDYGRNWSEVPLPAQIDSSVYFLAANPADPQLLFVVTNLGQLFRSTDGGEHWTGMKRRLGEIRTLMWVQ